MIKALGRDQTSPPAFRVNLASVPLVCSFRRVKIHPAPAPDFRPTDRNRQPKDWLAPGHPSRPNSATAALRPVCRSIPPAKFRHSGALISATKATLDSPLFWLRTQSRFRHEGLAHPIHIWVFGEGKANSRFSFHFFHFSY